jgi:selenocysteine lyase/cysteine desulfurase
VASLWDDVRRDFPALERSVYLNAAAASPIPRPVREAVSGFYREQEEEGDVRWDEWLGRKEETRAAVARFVGAEPSEIAFTPNTSTGINLVVDLLEGTGAVLSDELEFPTVTLPWLHRGIPVHFLPAVEGVVRLESFAIDQAPRAGTIAVSHVQFSNGCRVDLDALGAMKHGRHLVVSGSQSVGAFPIDVRRSAIDALATAGHKWLCAGYGAGFVYISRALIERCPPRAIGWLSVEDPYAFDNREYRVVAGARRSEMGCPSFAGIFALGAAVAYLEAIGVDVISSRVLELNALLTDSLERRGFTVLSPGGENRSGETLVAVKEPGRVAAALRQRGIFVTRKPQGLRVATHFYNNEADIEAFGMELGEATRSEA